MSLGRLRSKEQEETQGWKYTEEQRRELRPC